MSLFLQIENFIVDQDLAKELQCGICLQLLKAPRQCKNGHLFCLDCILKCLEKRSECPHCRTELQESDLARSLFVEKHLRSLQVYCRYHFKLEQQKYGELLPDPSGCNDILLFENKETHEKVCKYAFVLCKYSPKCSGVRKHDKEQHETECTYRPVACNYCKTSVQMYLMEEHNANCPDVPTECTKCGKECLRGELSNHVSSECPEAEIPCPFASQGCSFTMFRKQVGEHLVAEVSSHLLLLKKTSDAHFNSLSNQFSNTLKLQEERIQELERKLSENVTKVKWKLAGFSDLKNRNYLQSQKFLLGDSSWFIGLYTNGANKEATGYMSVFLFLDVEKPFPKDQHVVLKYSFLFKNFKDNSKSIKKDFQAKFPIKGGQGWGDRKMLKNKVITEDSGFLFRDTLHIVLSLSIKERCYKHTLSGSSK
eukprot:TRINITY_DN3177_c0_g1_i4.p1 TRINITY_DN3177_c0_g1~~TRINITY_DN3177_c0_g1_i4.p1  ORF type:complete len:424 (-),score=38.54 TRINITY_DN3177_c0_g1_i4:93-1364(-)